MHVGRGSIVVEMRLGALEADWGPELWRENCRGPLRNRGVILVGAEGMGWRGWTADHRFSAPSGVRVVYLWLGNANVKVHI